MAESLRHRIGIDIGRKLPAEQAVVWAAANDVRYFDIQCDLQQNAMERFDARTCAAIRDACARDGLHLGLRTLSAVNVAEVAPFLRDAADQYLRAYIDLAKAMAAEWVVVHGGYRRSPAQTCNGPSPSTTLIMTNRASPAGSTAWTGAAALRCEWL